MLPSHWTLLVAAAITTSLAAQKPATRLDSSPAGSVGTIAVAATGPSVYVVWTDQRNRPLGSHDVMFNRSTDGGATWLPEEVQLNSFAPQVASKPQIAVADASIYVMWERFIGTGPNTFFTCSHDGGATWLEKEMRLNEALGTAAAPRMIANGQTIFVVWWDPTGIYDVYFQRSNDGGTTWLPTETLLSPGPARSSQNPRIAVQGSSVYVAWEEAPAPQTSAVDIYFNRSLDGGETWLPAEVKARAGAPESIGGLGITASGSVVNLIWNNGFAGVQGIFTNRSSDEGATWRPSNIQVNVGQTNPVSQPSITSVGVEVYAVWQDLKRGTQDIRFNRSTDGGLLWMPSSVLIGSPAVGSFAGTPKILAEDRFVYVLWDDMGGILFNRSTDGGATWLEQPAVLATPASQFNRGNDFAVSGSSVYACWFAGPVFTNDHDVYCTIPFGVSPYGEGLAGSGELTPTIGATGIALIGEGVFVEVGNGLGGAAGALMVGDGPTSKVSIPFAGGTLHAIPALSVPLAMSGTNGEPGQGNASVPIAIPGDKAFVGLNLNLQAILIDTAAPRNLSMTSAIELWIL